MTRIESRPSRRGIWDYVFFIDILGHRQDPKVAAALEHLKRERPAVQGPGLLSGGGAVDPCPRMNANKRK